MKDGKLSETLNKIAGSDKWRRIILIAGVSGIALLLLSGLDISSCSSKSGTEFSVKAYSEQLEDNLEAAIERMEGAGKTRVLLTMENSVEYVYLRDSATKTKEVEPLIRGVLVLCEGGDKPAVVERVTNAVTKALDISTAKVCITKLSE